MLKYLLTITVFCFSVQAGLPEALNAFEHQRYKDAFDEFTYLDQEGNNIATYYLGKMYEEGLGVPVSKDNASNLYLKSYGSGNPKAAAALGRMMLRGDGIKQDIPQALNILKDAARAGDGEALFQLGEVYAEGKEVPKNYTYATGFYKMGALQGNAKAQYKLGSFYLFGRGVPQDYALALRWLTRSANQGYVQAQIDLADILENNVFIKNIVNAYVWNAILAAYNTDKIGEDAAIRRDALAKQMNDIKYLEIAQKTAREWKPLSEKETVPEAELMEPNPIIPDFNDETTMAELERQENVILSDGAEFGVSSEELEDTLANKRMLDLEVKMEKLPKAKQADGFLYLARIFENRVQDSQKAVYWYEKSAELGNSEAQFKLAQMYCKGEVVPLDLKQCYMWLLVCEKNADYSLKSIITATQEQVRSQLTPAQVNEATELSSTKRYKKEKGVGGLFEKRT